MSQHTIHLDDRDGSAENLHGALINDGNDHVVALIGGVISTTCSDLESDSA